MSRRKAQVNTSVVDEEFLNTVTSCDIDFEKDLFETFFESCEKNLEKMAESIKEKDDKAWRMSTHSLKGACASIGAFELSYLLEDAQTHEEKDYKGKATIIKDVEKEFVNVVEFLKKRLSKYK